MQVGRQISLNEAFNIAQSNPKIDYFVYAKGTLVLEKIFKDEKLVILKTGDVLFFNNEGKWLASAINLANTYSKKQI